MRGLKVATMRKEDCAASNSTLNTKLDQISNNVHKVMDEVSGLRRQLATIKLGDQVCAKKIGQKPIFQFKHKDPCYFNQWSIYP